MDPVSGAASIIAVIQISGQVFNLCREYCWAVKDARKDIQLLSDEVTALHDVLEHIADLAGSPGAARLSTLDLLRKSNGPVEQCLKELKALEVKLNLGHGEYRMKQLGWRALKWPLSSKDVQNTVMVIGRHKATFNLALNADQASLTLAVDQGMTQLKQDFATARTDEHQDKIIRWLSSTDPSSNHLAACKKHQPTTGEWFIKGFKMEEWKRTQSSLLWLHGIPGCGKTILSSTIIEHMKAYCDSKPGFAVAYFYFDFNDAEKQEASTFISSLVAQLCTKVVDLPEQLKKLHERCNNGQQKAAMPELKATLSWLMKDLEDVFIVVDALDECPKNERREEILELISEIKSWSPSNFHILVTSRQEPDIEEALTPLLTSLAIPIQGSQVESDIKLYIDHQLATDPKLRRWSGSVRAEIKNSLVAGANGMFRWVFCQLDALKRCKKKSALLNVLKGLPKTLDGTYERILTAIEEDYQQEARRALLWLAFSQRPLRVEEVAEAAVVDPELKLPFDPEERLHDPRNDLLEILGSLVTISSKGASSEAWDFGSDSGSEFILDEDWTFASDLGSERVRLAHFSVKEYLLSERILDGSASKFGATDIFANHFIAESCLLYVLHYDESDSKAVSLKDLECFPLLQYACQFWYIHVRLIPPESQEKIHPVIFSLFLSDTVLLSWLRVYRPDQPLRAPFKMPNDIGPPLFYASDIGLEAVVRLLLDAKADVNAEVNAETTYRSTALHRAAENGHDTVVQLLLKARANVDAENYGKWTALHLAAENGYDAVVRLLLEAKADVEAENDGKWTALHLAAENGHDAVVRLLLEAKADADAKNYYERTVLHSAVENQHETVVRLLLEAKADVDAKNIHGTTALHSAVENQHETVVRLLLEAKADVDAKNNFERTALHLAAQNGHDAVVRLLLEAKADFDARNNNKRTALHLAAQNGHDAVVRLLLETKAHVDSKNKLGKTALHLAAGNGRDTVVQLLLEAKADVEAKIDSGRTALCLAAYHEHKAVV